MARVNLSVKRNRIPELKQKFPAEVRRIVSDGADRMVDEARAIVPVDTGSLRRSITVSERGPTWAVVKAVGGAKGRRYAAYVEFGTRRMRARPYLRPAADIAMGQVKRELKALERRL